MHDFDAPAKLFYWPGEDGAEEAALYPSLRDALRAASDGELESAWIITEAGHILTPRKIEEIRSDMTARHARRQGARPLLCWRLSP